MKAIVDGDLVVALADGDIVGIDIPADLLGLPSDRLRYVERAIVDAAALSQFYIDAQGRKHAVQADPSWPTLMCAWDAVLISVAGAWSMQTETDRMNAIKVALGVEIDADAERVRRRYITPGSGQAMVYQRKSDEAHAFIAWRAVNPSATAAAGDYPIMSASLGIEGAALDDIAALVIATETAWLTAAAAIETARLGGKAAVDKCLTEAAARAARAAVVWPQ